MRTLQGPGRNNEPDPLVALARQIADARRQVDEAGAQVLRMAGLRAEPGKLVVEGDLSVPSGKITLAGVDQDLAAALATLMDVVNTELTSAADSSSADGMAFGTSEVAAYTGTPLVIPEIYKSVVVMCIAGCRCTNTTASAIYFYARPRIEASTGAWATGATLQTAISAGWQGTVSSPEVYRFTFPGTPGQTLTFKAMAYASTAVGASASNFAGFSYIALMSRT